MQSYPIPNGTIENTSIAICKELGCSSSHFNFISLKYCTSEKHLTEAKPDLATVALAPPNCNFHASAAELLAAVP